MSSVPVDRLSSSVIEGIRYTLKKDERIELFPEAFQGGGRLVSSWFGLRVVFTLPIPSRRPTAPQDKVDATPGGDHILQVVRAVEHVNPYRVRSISRHRGCLWNFGRWSEVWYSDSAG